MANRMAHYTTKCSLIQSMNREQLQSNLFLIRLWVDQEGGEQGEWHGKVQHMNSSQVASFDDWATLKMTLAKMLDLNGGEGQESALGIGESSDEMRTSSYPTMFP